MSLKNYMFSSINTGSYSRRHLYPIVMASETSATTSSSSGSPPSQNRPSIRTPLPQSPLAASNTPATITPTAIIVTTPTSRTPTDDSSNIAQVNVVPLNNNNNSNIDNNHNNPNNQHNNPNNQNNNQNNHNNNNNSNDNNETKNGFLKIILKVWSYISVEPMIACWLIPSLIFSIGIENLALEKSCRVNFKYPDIVCDNMIYKSMNNIDCVVVRARNEIQMENIDNITDIGLTTTTTTSMPLEVTTAKVFQVLNELWNITQLEEAVCKAEIDSQRLETELNLLTSPIQTIFGVIMILFAGGWSDRRGLRKPLMLLPLLGDLGGLIVYLIAAIFMHQLPMQFNSILSVILTSAGGGINLMFMGVYSYLTAITKEEDRTFRYGIFAVFVPIIPVISLPLSGILFRQLGYIKLLLLVCIPFNVLGILYLIFVLKEVKDQNNTDKKVDDEIELSAARTDNDTNEQRINNNHQLNGVDNPGYDGQSAIVEHNKNGQGTVDTSSDNKRSRPKFDRSTSVTEKIKQNSFVQFFNPIVAIDCYHVLVRKRNYNGRTVIIFILVLYFLIIVPAFGESGNEYNFARIKLNWDELKMSPFNTYASAITQLGTILMIGCFCKLFKLTEMLAGFLAIFATCTSRLFFASATSSAMMYIGRTLDMFTSVPILVLKSLISTFVESAETGKIFSLLALLEVCTQFIAVAMYSIVYERTLETFPGAFYICSFFCFAIGSIMFAILYFIIKKKHKREENERKALADEAEASSKIPENGEKRITTINVNESTHM